MNKDEKDKENQRKSSSPTKPRSSRPRTAPISGSRKVAPKIISFLTSYILTQWLLAPSS